MLNTQRVKHDGRTRVTTSLPRYLNNTAVCCCLTLTGLFWGPYLKEYWNQLTGRVEATFFRPHMTAVSLSPSSSVFTSSCFAFVLILVSSASFSLLFPPFFSFLLSFFFFWLLPQIEINAFKGAFCRCKTYNCCLSLSEFFFLLVWHYVMVIAYFFFSHAIFGITWKTSNAESNECGARFGWGMGNKIALQERQGGIKLNWLGEGRVTTLLDHEFLKESYDWQSHAAGLCVHTSHCSAATARTHSQTNAHSVSVVSFGCLCNKNAEMRRMVNSVHWLCKIPFSYLHFIFSAFFCTDSDYKVNS